MIRINLGPPDASAHRTRRARVVLAVGVAYLGALAALGGWYTSLLRIEADLTRAVTISNRELETLRATLARGEGVRDSLRDLAKRAQVIQELTRGEDTAIRTLNALLGTLPGDLWLTSLEERGGEVRAAGAAFSPRAVAEFTSNLEASGFTAVEIIRSRQDPAAIPPGPIGFEVTCRLYP